LTKKRLPDFLIVGAAKSGTTSLYYYLDHFDDVFMSEIKEPHFFSFYNDRPEFKSSESLNNVVSEIGEYEALYKAARPEQLLGEASTSYLYYHKKAIENIQKVYGEDYRKIKIIIGLRNPVDRAWSQINHFKKFDHEPLEPLEAIDANVIADRMKQGWNTYYDYLGFGNYYNQVKSYVDHFDRVHVFTDFELKEDRVKTVNEILNFLFENYRDYSDELKELDKTYNVSGIPKNRLSKVIWNLTHKKNPIKALAAVLVPEKIKQKFYNKISGKILKPNAMPEAFRQKIYAGYKTEIYKLENLLQRDLSSWKTD